MGGDDSKMKAEARVDVKTIQKQPALIRTVSSVSASNQAYVVQVEQVDENGASIENTLKYYIVDGESIVDANASNPAEAAGALNVYLRDRKNKAGFLCHELPTARNLLPVVGQIMGDDERVKVTLINLSTAQLVEGFAVYQKEGGGSVTMVGGNLSDSTADSGLASFSSESERPESVENLGAAAGSVKPKVARSPKSRRGAKRS